MSERGAPSARVPAADNLPECVARPVAATAKTLRRLAYSDPEVFPVLLDSTAGGALGRYCILAAYPQGALWQDGAGQLHGEGLSSLASPDGSGFLAALERAWRVHSAAAAAASPGAARSPAPERLLGPFRGGWMVFLGYELAAEIEPKLRLARVASRQQHSPAAFALRVPAALVCDQLTGAAWALAEADQPALLDALQAAVAALPDEEPCASGSAAAQSAVRGIEEESPGRFRVAVEAALEHIRAGDIYQANLSRLWQAQVDSCGAGASAPVGSLYERLRAANPAPFAGLAQFKGWSLLCSSPERLVRVDQGRVDTRPIAGTRARSRIDGRDRGELAALMAHPKERAEHIMLIDLERNDLGRICQPGSVRADEFMHTETYAHVHHIVSNVSGELLPRLTPIDVLRALFPGGTITGCPKFRCMQIIAELEGEARGAYTGALGFINHDGSMDLNILIRSLTLQAQQLEFRAGAGIVADSSWQRELAETRAKARGLLAALT